MRYDSGFSGFLIVGGGSRRHRHPGYQHNVPRPDLSVPTCTTAHTLVCRHPSRETLTTHIVFNIGYAALDKLGAYLHIIQISTMSSSSEP